MKRNEFNGSGTGRNAGSSCVGLIDNIKLSPGEIAQWRSSFLKNKKELI